MTVLTENVGTRHGITSASADYLKELMAAKGLFLDDKPVPEGKTRITPERAEHLHDAIGEYMVEHGLTSSEFADEIDCTLEELDTLRGIVYDAEVKILVESLDGDFDLYMSLTAPVLA